MFWWVLCTFCIFWYFSLPHELFTTVLISKLEIFCCLFFLLLISSWISMIVRKHTLYDSNSFKFIEICLWLRIRICLSECSIDAWKERVFCCCWVEHLSVKSCLLTVVFGSSKSLLILSYSPSVAENGGCWFSVLQSRQLLRMWCWGLQLELWTRLFSFHCISLCFTSWCSAVWCEHI